MFSSMAAINKPDSRANITFSVTADGEVLTSTIEILLRPCEFGEVYSTDRKQCQECPGGTYNFEPTLKSVCKTCPAGARCLGGGEMSLQAGYWRLSHSSGDVRKCRVLSVCEGGEDPKEQCSIGHSGAYCSVCEEGYTKDSSTSECYACSEAGLYFVYTIAIVIPVILLLVGLYSFRNREGIGDYLGEWADKVQKKMEDADFSAWRTKFKILIVL